MNSGITEACRNRRRRRMRSGDRMTPAGASGLRMRNGTVSDCSARMSVSASRSSISNDNDARRAGFRQAAPFAESLKKNPTRPGRRPGRAYGRKGHRRVPPRVDERYDVPLPAQCPTCTEPVVEPAVATQYQEELPARVVVRQFDLHVGRCTGCGRRVQGRQPLQPSDAIGAAAAQIDTQVIALVVVLNKQLGLSFAKIATLLQQLYGLT
jgi:transposase